eukprot:5302257-Pyramimonas_sp.AAC.1
MWPPGLFRDASGGDGRLSGPRLHLAVPAGRAGFGREVCRYDCEPFLPKIWTPGSRHATPWRHSETRRWQSA